VNKNDIVDPEVIQSRFNLHRCILAVHSCELATMRKVYSIAVLAALGLVFQACGQKGPLRLPERAKPVAVPTAATPSVSDQSKEP
jgi:predicted small lipoprotein YifL